MWNKHRSKWFSAFLVLLLLLSACSNSSGGETKQEGNKSKKKEKTEEVKVFTLSDFSDTVKNDEELIEDGILNYALETASPFEGTLNYNFYQGNPDAEILQFFDESLFKRNEDHEITNDGAATYELSDDNKTITITIRDNVYWHDGEPVTADDVKFSYEIIGSPDYEGVRYGELQRSIVGMEEYHEGKADDISGIEIIDEKTLSITHKQANPSLLTGIWSYATPRHYLGDVPISEMMHSDKIRVNPIGFGPFKVKKIVPGESVEYERFDDYWAGKPKLKGVILKVVNPNVAIAALKKGEFDISEFPSGQINEIKDASNVQLLSKMGNVYQYIGFKLGHYDKDKEENVMDRPKLQNKKLRQAIAYALDNETIGKRMYHGLLYLGNSVIIPYYPKYHDESLEAYGYDPEKAKALLDEAGYIDVNGDGYREDPDGNEFTLTYLQSGGTDALEAKAQKYLEYWKDIGLKVELKDGRLHDFNSFSDQMKTDDPGVEIFSGAWSTGASVDPSGIHGKHSQFNYPRFVDERSEELLKKGISPEAFDMDYRKAVYKEWQALMHEEAYLVPTHYRMDVTAVNNRVKNFTVDSKKINWHEVGLTKEKPEVDK